MIEPVHRGSKSNLKVRFLGQPVFYDNLSDNLLCDVVFFSLTILDIQQVPVLLPSAQISLTGRIQSVSHFSLNSELTF